VAPQDIRSGDPNRSDVLDGMRTVLKLTDEEAAAIDQDSTPLQLPRWTSLTHVQLEREALPEAHHIFARVLECL
jgi:hypothetical protein